MSQKEFRGSEWNRWDLHVHTPSSIQNHYTEGNEEETWEKYISSLEKLDPSIKVIGVNDYWFIDGFKKLKEAKAAGRLENIELLLPVIEFRIKMLAGVQFGELKRINFHVIFDDGDDDWIDTIQSQFLNALEHNYYKEDGSKWDRSITKDSVEELGRNIKAGVPKDKLSAFGSDLKEGFNNLNVDEEEVFKKLDRDSFKGRYLTAVGKTEWDQLKWDEGSISIKKSIINKADIVFTAALSPESYKNARKKLQEQKVNSRLLDCSDAHAYADAVDKEGNPIKDRLGNTLTWIKADTTFNGLKQIKYEFDERVRTQEANPYIDNTKYTVDSIEVINSLTTAKQKIFFNRDLVTIIGGKGSGKSLLLSLICATSQNYEPHNAIKGSNTTVNYEFVDKGGDKQQISSLEISGDTDCNEPIFCVKQEELAETSKDKALVREAYLKELGIYDQGSSYQSITDTSERLLNQIEEAGESIKELEELTKYREDAESGRISFAEYLIKRIHALKETIKKTSNEDTKQLIDEISATIRSGRDIKNWIDKPGISAIKNDVQAVNDKIEEFNKSLADLGLKSSVGLIDLDSISKEFKAADDEARARHKELQETYGTQQATLKTHKINEDIPVLLKTLAGIQNDLSLFENAELGLVNTGNVISEKREELSSQFSDGTEDGIPNAISKQVDFIDQTFLEFSEERKESYIFQQLFSGVSVDARIFFNSSKLVEDLTQCFLKGKSGDLNSTIFKGNTPTYNLFFSWIINELWSFYDKAKNGNNFLARVTGISLSGEERFLEIIFKKWYEYISVSTAITNDFEGTKKEIEIMSTGELATVLLKLKLVTEGLDKQIILLDQPEDHLDNSFIAHGLVDLLKSLKKERQVIIATHNANLVVGTDSEQVIIAHGVKEPYTTGGIESEEVKDAIVHILEGGVEAFEKRLNRYS